MQRRRASLALALVIGIALALLALPRPALALPHVLLLKTNVADGAVVGSAPGEVRLWFSAMVVPKQEVTLTDASGRRLELGSVRIEPYLPADAGLNGAFDQAYLFLCSVNPGSRPGALVARLPALGAGTYRLEWSVAPVGGGFDVRGAQTFRVEPGAANQAASAAETRTVQADDLLLTLAVSPNLPGQNFAALSVANLRRPAPAPIEEVRLRLLDAAGRERGEWPAQPRGDGRYEVSGGELDAPGAWTIVAVVRRAGMPATFARFDWTVGGESPWHGWLWYALAGLALLAVRLRLFSPRRSTVRLASSMAAERASHALE